jgi:hypothetical protein
MSLPLLSWLEQALESNLAPARVDFTPRPNCFRIAVGVTSGAAWPPPRTTGWRGAEKENGWISCGTGTCGSFSAASRSCRSGIPRWRPAGNWTLPRRGCRWRPSGCAPRTGWTAGTCRVALPPGLAGPSPRSLPCPRPPAPRYSHCLRPGLPWLSTPTPSALGGVWSSQLRTLGISPVRLLSLANHFL